MVTFKKHISNADYPNMGCNSEFYTEPDSWKIESLSPLLKLAPEASLSHTAFWTLTR